MTVADRVGRDPIVSEALERWNRCDEAEDAQRKSILLAKQFRAGDQWPSDIKIQRQGSQAVTGQAAQPPRPCLTIDRLSQPVRSVSNQIRAANYAIDVLPNGHGADNDTADLFKGYLRRMQNEARDESPIEWAADQAIEGGIGWFRLCTRYVVNDFDPSRPIGPEATDQELCMKRITNNLTVYCDPNAQRPTRSDARFLLVTEDLSREEFQRRYPRAEYASLDGMSATGDKVTKKWVTKDQIRIAEYWRITYQTRYLIRDEMGIHLVDTKPPKGADILRRIEQPIVEMFTINALEVLDHAQWTGQHIPLIPILGEELNVDGQIVLRGVIQEGMDAQRMVNYMYSGAVEQIALATKAPWIIPEEGLTPAMKTNWQYANIYNYQFLTFLARDDMGRELPQPVRNASEPPIQAMAMMLNVSEEAIKATTGISIRPSAIRIRKKNPDGPFSRCSDKATSAPAITQTM
jgi:hypothetical protein